LNDVGLDASRGSLWIAHSYRGDIIDNDPNSPIENGLFAAEFAGPCPVEVVVKYE
jgi:hypothetical protein